MQVENRGSGSLPLCNPTSLHHCSGPGANTQGKTYHTIKERQDSFKNHPHIFNLKNSPSDLAEQGFYYNDKDIICVRCKVILPPSSTWKKGEKLKDVHKRLQIRRCPFTIETSYENGSNDEEDDDDYETSGDDTDEVDNSTTQRNYLQSDNMSPASARGPLSPATYDKEKLRDENHRLRITCYKCQVDRIQTLFLPCRHLITCEKCADDMDNCLLCNATILGTVRTYLG